MTGRPNGRRRSGGQSLVEFALVLPLIVLTLMGILDFGRGILAYNTLAESARQANRLAIVDQNQDRIKAVAVAHAPAVGLTAANVNVCITAAVTPTACGAAPCLGCLARVTASTTFVPITPVISLIFPSGIGLSSTSVGPIENVCPRTGRPSCP